MSRTMIPFAAHDVSSLARALCREIDSCGDTPGHQQMLNMLARSAGYGNFQHLRAQSTSLERLANPPMPPEPVDFRRIERTARHYDHAGVLMRWPPKAHQRLLCLWVLWSLIPARQKLNEAEINAVMNSGHSFGDHALLRRELVDAGLLERSKDCRIYQRVECRPAADAAVLIGHIRDRNRQSATGPRVSVRPPRIVQIRPDVDQG